nr:late blight resistance protein R1-A-like [Ipomoea batatas]
MRLCLSGSRPSPTQPTTAGNHRRDDDRPTLPSAAPPNAFTHRLPFAFTLLLCFSYATDDRPTLPSAIPPPAFTHRLRPNQHRLPSAFAHRLRTSTATLAGFRGVPQNHQSRNPPSSRSWQPELAHRSFPPAPFMEIHRSEPKPVSDLNQKLTLRRITASRQSFATAPVATLALDALPCWKEQRSPEEKTEVQGAGRRSVRLALQICFCSTGFADWLLYKHLSSLQTCLEQDFKVGECDEALKALEAQMRDVSIELRFQIEHQLRLFYLGKSMKLRLHSGKKLLPILSRAKEDIETIYRDLNEDDIETMDLESFVLRMVESMNLNEDIVTADLESLVVELAGKYVTLPVSKKVRLRWAQEFFHTLNGVVNGGDLKYVMEMLWKHFTLPFLRGLALEDQQYDAADAFAVSELMGLVHLRFLGSYSALKLNTLPLFMLWNLQRLELDDDYSQNEPLNIWGLPQLKKLITRRGNIRLVPPRSVHHNLESIAFLDYRSCTEELFMRIPNLRILGVNEDFNTILKRKVWFGSLACLYKLEYLKVHGNVFNPKCTTIHSMGTLSIENVLPNLKTLELLNTYLNWESLYIVGMLPKLEVLILARNAAFGKKWKPKDGGFHGLKLLSIYKCDLQIWKATSGHFPVLECLALMHIPSLKKIPSDFADIATLKSIKLYNCLKSAISSAKCIQEEQREYGNNDFSVDISRYDDLDEYFWGGQ